ncbi:COMM domain-containing protein 6 isoform X2 [Gopherus flavomarginatus]|uniref:COMM domain-containing protein 6 isoform X2 n=1 Tax=Gopherus flavomarginatus TaxID=286002 RepID=UPI0021CBC47A|nr:COMM domain-containing protein 6 isoform X2 [Gopherus flavomarginatus]
MEARAAVVGARSLEPLDFGSSADIIKLIPKDLFAELCERIIQHLHGQSPGVDTVELCQRFQTAGVEMNVADLAEIINVVSFLFGTAAKNNLSAEELSAGLGNAIIDIRWKLGMAVSSDSCRSLKYPYVTMTLKVAEPSGQIMSKSFEMTIPQFQDFFRHFKEMAAVLETV